MSSSVVPTALDPSAPDASNEPPVAIAEPGIMVRLRQARERPGHALDTLIALARGQFYKLWYRMRGRKFTVGKHFRCYGRLSVVGAGEVILGDYVLCERNVSLWTYAEGAKIIIGDKVNMGGTQFGCVKEIRVDRLAVLADANIMDSDFHSIFVNRRSPDAPVRVRPVHIGENAWICGRVAVLAGTKVGENSVVGYGAVCARHYPPNSIIVGNPAKVVGSVPTDADARNLNPEEWITQHDMAR